ncbi:MAG: hypothetical protein E7488_05245 [Ruminococcaceae bacterium]|nr:hypothetical protein [Oscillospiraceae bacterium]
MNRFLKKASVVLAMAVAFSAMPTQVFAAACDHHPQSANNTLSKDADGNVVYYIAEQTHYNSCEECDSFINHESHADNGTDGRCVVCEVTIDNNSVHQHSYTTVSYGFKNEFGHTIVCNDSYCMGEFKTHTNCVVGDNNNDGTWDCDYCGWDGVIIGAGGGQGSSCSHSYDNKQFGVEEDGHFPICDNCEANGNKTTHTDENDNNGSCDICGASVAFDAAANMYMHSHTSNGTSFAQDVNDHGTVCSDCGSGYWEGHKYTAGSSTCYICNYTAACQHTHKMENGEYVYEIGPAGHRPICASCGQPYDGGVHYDNNSDGNCDVCGAAILCDHDNAGRWWDTDVTEHTYHCTCGYPVAPAQAHADAVINSDGTAGTDGLCDECGVGVDSRNEHTHTWSPAWSHNKDNTEHFHNCTDANCTRRTDAGMHCDTDGDSSCDVCGEALAAGGNWCTGHTDNGDRKADKDKHYSICADCGNTFNGTAHTAEADRFHSDADRHYAVCEICEYSIGNGEAHVKDTEAGYDRETTKHYDICKICHSPYGAGHAHNPDTDRTCTDCGMPDIDSDGIHSHTENTNRLHAEEYMHFTRCETCDQRVNGSGHSDDDSDGFCDKCNASVVKEDDGGYRHDHKAGTEYEVSYSGHTVLCSCGEPMEYFNHTDSNKDGECDDCRTLVEKDDAGDIVHKHTPDENWNDTGDGDHSCGCTECDEKDAVREGHTDVNMDSECDICKGYVQHNESENFVSLIHNGVSGHAKTCADCGGIIADTFAQHEAGEDWICSSEEGHKKICIQCGEFAGTEQPHKDADKDEACDECGIGVDENAKHNHVINGWTAEEQVHFERCEHCGMETGAAEPHTDTDDDGRCDGCNATLDDDNCHEHSFKHRYESNDTHVEYCEGCNMRMGAGPHDDINDNGICDVCNTAYVKIRLSFEQTDAAALRAELEAAVDKAINNGDYTGLEAFFESQQDCTDFAEMYVNAKAEESTAYLDFVINSFVLLESENPEAEAKPFFDNAKAAVNGGTLGKLFAMDVVAAAMLEGGHWGSSCTNLDSHGTLSYVAKIDAAEVKANRTWYVYATADGETYTRVGQSAKGAAEVVFETADTSCIFALIYAEEAAATPTPTPEVTPTPEATSKPSSKPTATPTPEATAAPTPAVTPAPTAEPTATPEVTPTPEPTPEMPAEADTTIAEDAASEEVVEAVKENVTVSEGTATVDAAAVEAVVEATKEDEAVVLPLVQTTEEVVNKAEVDTEALTAVADAEKDVVIEFTDVTIKLDAEAVKAITEQADGETIEIRAVRTETHTLTEAQQKKLKDMDTAVVVTAQIFSDGEYIGNFRGGRATVMLPFEAEEGKDAKDYRVYYIDEKGDLKKVAAEIVDGYIVFTTVHFSDYVIVYEGTALGGEADTVVPQTPAAESSLPIIPIVIGIAVIIIGGVILIMKKRKSEE